MLEFLFQVARQFPEEGLAPHSLFLFVSLAMRLVNEREAHVKEQVQGVLKCLLGRIPQKQFFEVLDLCLKWVPHRSSIEKEEEKPKSQNGKENGKKKRKRSEEEEEESPSSSSSSSTPPSALEPLTPKRRVGFLVLSLIVDVCGHAENKTEAAPSASSSGSFSFLNFVCLFWGWCLLAILFLLKKKCRRNSEINSAHSSFCTPSQPPFL